MQNENEPEYKEWKTKDTNQDRQKDDLEKREAFGMQNILDALFPVWGMSAGEVCAEGQWERESLAPSLEATLTFNVTIPAVLTPILFP